MSAGGSLRKSIVTAFRLNGLSIKGDACDFLVSQLSPIDDAERDDWLNKVIEYIQKRQNLPDSIVRREYLEVALKECCKSEVNSSDDIIQVISAFDVPRFTYDAKTKKFLPEPRSNSRLFDSANAKIHLFRNRYVVIKQRIERNELLRKADGGGAKICAIDLLLSRANSDHPLKAIVLGLISQLKEGKYYLEDPTGVIPLDLSSTIYHTGLYAEYCVVLAEGVYVEGVLKVSELAMPPAEAATVSRNYFGQANTFGGPSETSLKFSERMLKLEKENEEVMLVFIADVWLDDAKVMEKLRTLLAGYNEYPPAAIIFMGNFLSGDAGHVGMQRFLRLKDLLTAFGERVAEHPRLLAETLFVVIPGPQDSPYSNILPCPELPNFISEGFTKLVANSVFATNPCRLQYCSQEIVIMRQDILTKLCRNCIHFPQHGDISLHFVKTMLSQSHLTPLPASVCPTYWSEDAALALYPLPDVLVVADTANAFTLTSTDCVVFNPSSFSKKKFCFNVYMPATRLVEDSQIPED